MSLRITLGSITLAVLLLNTGCSILPESNPATLYRLPSAATLSEHTAATFPVRLGIATPGAGHLLNSNRIVVYPEGNVVNVYEGVRWHEDAPEMLQARLISDLQQRQLFTGVSSDRLPHDVLLLSELRHFQSEYDTSPPSVHLQLDVQLLTTQQRKPLAASSFVIRTRAESTEIPDVVNAFGNASDMLAEQLSAWLVAQSSDLRSAD
ncbi:ABC-type transport auxiliary lipoprotein family protein [Halomonas alkaliantarctica]|uniref:ABC-type transport auxiliary lipoprotein family protein n=1 Tax=Halomonas alkaliantarctica TaxID=232346 RepID=UPI00265A868D|nr:ABC-type transport auxiliary lipoprotein family protein [Halomonas alkaliantarctica]